MKVRKITFKIEEFDVECSFREAKRRVIEEAMKMNDAELVEAVVGMMIILEKRRCENCKKNKGEQNG